MAVEVELRTLIDGLENIRAFAEIEMPAKLSFRVAKALRKAESSLRNDYSPAYNKLLERYREAKEDGTLWIPPARQREFQEAVDALQDETVILEGVKPLSFAELEEIRAKIAPKLLMTVGGWLVEDPEE